MSEDLKFCKDCAHCYKGLITGRYFCKKAKEFRTPDLVTGWTPAVECCTARQGTLLVERSPGVMDVIEGCGRDAQWFEAKPAEIEEPQMGARIDEPDPPIESGVFARWWRRFLDE